MNAYITTKEFSFLPKLCYSSNYVLYQKKSTIFKKHWKEKRRGHDLGFTNKHGLL